MPGPQPGMDRSRVNTSKANEIPWHKGLCVIFRASVVRPGKGRLNLRLSAYYNNSVVEV